MTEYARRDIIDLDKRGGHYARHIAAMTAEGLHSKTVIAAELAWRDSEIKALEILVAKLLECSSPKVPEPVGVPRAKGKFKP